MSDHSFRFLHASDFQLDEPLGGLTEVPDHLRDILIDGGYQAAERVFDAAISERVDFVALTGTLLDLRRPAARALSFLAEQFERLSSAGITVYWSSSDPSAASRWPDVLPRSETVHCFSSDRVESLAHEGTSGFVVRVLGRGGAEPLVASAFTPPMTGQYTVAIVSGVAESTSLARREIDYWALAGQENRRTLFCEPRVAHACGSPQGRGPRNIGPHGCTLVSLRKPRETQLRFIPCDVLRWGHERVLVSGAANWEDLRETMSQRVGEMRSQTPTLPLLVRWTLTAADGQTDLATLQSHADRAERWLKKQYGYHAEPVWPVSVTIDARQQIPVSAYDEDTLLGDYLRAVKAMREDAQLETLESPCAPESLSPALRWLTDWSEATGREDVLREAAVLGAALLRGEDAI